MCIKEGKQAGGANIWYAVLADIGGLRAVCRGWPGPEVLLSRLQEMGIIPERLFSGLLSAHSTL